MVTADDIALKVLETFDSLPAKRKPQDRGNGTREWVPLAGIVLYREGWPLVCASLGTGMKCLPESKVKLANGRMLHDWHAEVVAIRAFNRWLLDSCKALATGIANPPSEPHKNPVLDPSIWLRTRTEPEKEVNQTQPFGIRSDVRIYMYCSEAPCGDASMELVMEAQEDATPWERPPVTPNSTDTDELFKPSLLGRGHFSQLGIVRRKPARPDAPMTLSKSCTDKLAQIQFLSLLSSTTSLLIYPENAYIHSLVLPKSQHVIEGIERAFGPDGRLAQIQTDASSCKLSWWAGYMLKWMSVVPTKHEFGWSRRVQGVQVAKFVPSNMATVYTPHFQESLINGVLQGRKLLDPKGASKICRRSMLAAVAEVAGAVGALVVVEGLKERSYGGLKGHLEFLEYRRRVKGYVREVMANDGWVRNDGDDGWQVNEEAGTTSGK